MKLLGLGIDVVEVLRIETAVDRFGEAFLRRVYTEKEIAYCSKQKRPGANYAARFAAKEALAKALGTGIGEHAKWCELEVLRAPSGEPKARFLGRAKATADRLGVSDVKVSLTHAREYAAANVVLLGEES